MSVLSVGAAIFEAQGRVLLIRREARSRLSGSMRSGVANHCQAIPSLK